MRENTKNQTDSELEPVQPRAKTLLLSMLSALDEGDEVTYFTCFELLQEVTLEMLDSENDQDQP